MPKLNRVAPTFPVADVDATIRWYETYLGFTSHPFPENPPYVFASVCGDQV
jgi:catechol 2,3-dioxygenase-like lactoylglutathione lyase family enzyme